MGLLTLVDKVGRKGAGDWWVLAETVAGVEE